MRIILAFVLATLLLALVTLLEPYFPSEEKGTFVAKDVPLSEVLEYITELYGRETLSAEGPLRNRRVSVRIDAASALEAAAMVSAQTRIGFRATREGYLFVDYSPPVQSYLLRGPALIALHGPTLVEELGIPQRDGTGMAVAISIFTPPYIAPRSGTYGITANSGDDIRELAREHIFYREQDSRTTHRTGFTAYLLPEEFVGYQVSLTGKYYEPVFGERIELSIPLQQGKGQRDHHEYVTIENLGSNALTTALLFTPGETDDEIEKNRGLIVRGFSGSIRETEIRRKMRKLYSLRRHLWPEEAWIQYPSGEKEPLVAKWHYFSPLDLKSWFERSATPLTPNQNEATLHYVLRTVTIENSTFCFDDIYVGAAIKAPHRN